MLRLVIREKEREREQDGDLPVEKLRPCWRRHLKRKHLHLLVSKSFTRWTHGMAIQHKTSARNDPA